MEEIIRSPMAFLKRWYTEGLLMNPPPCMYSDTFRKNVSENTSCGPLSCTRIGRWGLTDFGEKYRSQLMFLAYWLSVTSMILLIPPVCSISSDETIVKANAWTIGKVDGTNNTDVALYVGLEMLTVRCTGDACPDFTGFKWSSDECIGAYCDECESSATGTATAVIVSFVTMLPQISTNLQRSRPDGDMNCQKFLGMLTSLIGFFSTLGAISSYMGGCFNDLPSCMECKYSIVQRKLRYTAFLVSSPSLTWCPPSSVVLVF
jgi:hypothetical protein